MCILSRYIDGNFSEKFPDKASDHFDIIFANPPLKSLDFEDVDSCTVKKSKNKKQLLFLALILKMLKPGDVQPTYLMEFFGSSQAHVKIRKHQMKIN